MHPAGHVEHDLSRTYGLPIVEWRVGSGTLTGVVVNPTDVAVDLVKIGVGCFSADGELLSYSDTFLIGAKSQLARTRLSRYGFQRHAARQRAGTSNRRIRMATAATVIGGIAALGSVVAYSATG